MALLVIYLFLLGSVLYISAVDFAFNHVMKPHQKERVEIMLGFKSDPHGTGYNVNQSIISIGSGGFSGKGYLQGTQTKFKFVPAQSTDFIFCTVGEEWGFLGSVVVIG
jgi:rod shape determining protein RodA